MPNKFIDFKAIRKDMRQLGIFAILAGLVGYFLPTGVENELQTRGVYGILVAGIFIWFASVIEWVIGLKRLWGYIKRLWGYLTPIKNAPKMDE